MQHPAGIGLSARAKSCTGSTGPSYNYYLWDKATEFHVQEAELKSLLIFCSQLG